MTQVNRSRATEEGLRSLALCDDPAATTAELGWEGKTEGGCVVRDGCIKDMSGVVLATWTGTWWEPMTFTDEIAPELRDSYLSLALDTEITRAAADEESGVTRAAALASYIPRIFCMCI